MAADTNLAVKGHASVKETDHHKNQQDWTQQDEPNGRNNNIEQSKQECVQWLRRLTAERAIEGTISEINWGKPEQAGL